MEATTALELEEEGLPAEVRRRVVGTTPPGLAPDRGQTPRVGVHLVGAAHVSAGPAPQAVATPVVTRTGHPRVPGVPGVGTTLMQEATKVGVAATQEPTARPTQLARTAATQLLPVKAGVRVVEPRRRPPIIGEGLRRQVSVPRRGPTTQRQTVAATAQQAVVAA